MAAVKERVITFVFPDGTVSESQDRLIDAAVAISGDLLKSCLPTGTTEVPEPLHWVWVELAVKRFNRVGSEGMRIETIEGHRVDYDTGDDLAPYRAYIDHYLASLDDAGAKQGKVRFL